MNHRDELEIGGCSAVKLAEAYGTPVHVVHENRLLKTAESFRATFKSIYPGKVSVHYAFKCNSIPGVINVIQKAGLKAEVMSPFELNLALNLGFKSHDIIVNGPCKPRTFLAACIHSGVRFIIIDSLEELSVFYVSVTRAKKDVCFSSSRRRIHFSGEKRNTFVSCLLSLPGIQCIP